MTTLTEMQPAALAALLPDLPKDFVPYIQSVVPLFDGHGIRFSFPNGYGASVVRNSLSYGGTEGLFEIAVVNRKGDLTFNTPVMAEVMGWLSSEEALAVLQSIFDLPSESNGQLDGDAEAIEAAVTMNARKSDND